MGRQLSMGVAVYVIVLSLIIAAAVYYEVETVWSDIRAESRRKRRRQSGPRGGPDRTLSVRLGKFGEL